MGAEDKGFKKSLGDSSAAEVTHDQGHVDETHHGWAPDVGQADDKTFDPQTGSDTASASERAEAGPDVDATPAGVGGSSTRRGEDVSEDEPEDGRENAGTQGPSQRPVGTSSPTDSTGIDPHGPIDQESPTAPSGDQGG
ncbi:MAG: hypothetical protein H0V19_09360 [Euzebyales bacterium]|nr:hypothetical protein [Euzebyales bacterium]